MITFILRLTVASAIIHSGTRVETNAAEPIQKDHLAVLRQENLVAWCIVPFDASKRGPAERAKMLKELGIERCAYDWREQHVSSFEQEIIEYRKHGIELFAFWGVHDQAFKLFEQYKLKPQIWQILATPGEGARHERIEASVQQILPLAVRTKRMGCKLGLYNHGGWGGEPNNLAAVCQRLHQLDLKHVGIVYNFHHGHGHIHDWADAFNAMLPFLHCVNLNGMNIEAKPKILGIGRGQHERAMIRTILESSYDGPIGILDHRPAIDAREALKENLDGLNELRRQWGASKKYSEQQSTSKQPNLGLAK